MRRTHLSGRPSRRLTATVTLALATALVVTSQPANGSGTPTTTAPASPAAVSAVPGLTVSTAVSGLSQPWDVQPLPDGSLLITERTTKRLLRSVGGRVSQVAFPSGSVWAAGETGLMGLEVDPAFASNRRFYACHGGFNSSRPNGRDVRVVAYQLSADSTRATRVRDLVTGIPATSGRHGGCRLLIARNGALLVGTGDAAVGTNPRNLRSLGGKVLRLNRFSGAPLKRNPYVKAASPAKRLIVSYGHRNLQGLAQRADGEIYSAEHGPTRDDEINRIVPRGDYGWHPVPGYNESVPMTNQRLKGPQRAASWRSGAPTIATSGAAFVRGSRWGDLDGTLAVAALKGERMVFMRFNGKGRLVRTTTPAQLRGLGRLRSVTPLGNGDLLVTTANGTDDRVLRISPQG